MTVFRLLALPERTDARAAIDASRLGRTRGFADLAEPYLCLSKKYISTAGLVLRVYTGDISILLNHVLGFRPLSRPLTVTAMDGPMIIKELDHKPAVYYYDKYIHTPDFRSSRSPFRCSSWQMAMSMHICRRDARSMAASFSISAAPSVQRCAFPTATRS